MTVRGLRVDVLKPNGSDCTNGGVTSRFGTFVLVNPAVPLGTVAPTEADARTLKVVKRTIGGRLYVHAEPLAPPPDGHIGWMAGGNFIHTSDSRYYELTGVPYPISVHDRSETPELYAALST